MAWKPSYQVAFAVVNQTAFAMLPAAGQIMSSQERHLGSQTGQDTMIASTGRPHTHSPQPTAHGHSGKAGCGSLSLSANPFTAASGPGSSRDILMKSRNIVCISSLRKKYTQLLVSVCFFLCASSCFKREICADLDSRHSRKSDMNIPALVGLRVQGRGQNRDKIR